MARPAPPETGSRRCAPGAAVSPSPPAFMALINRVRSPARRSHAGGHTGHPRHVVPKPGQAYEPEVPVKVREWICPALASPDLVLGAQPPKLRAHGSELHGPSKPRWPITSDLRQEPGALVAHAGICAGGSGVTCPPTATMRPSEIDFRFAPERRHSRGRH